jgi:hypothetical protein
MEHMTHLTYFVHTFSESSMAVATGATRNENGYAPVGCLTRDFRSNRPWRLPPAPPGMKMAMHRLAA